MKISDLATAGKGDRKAGAWRRIVSDTDNGRLVTIRHYGTDMLSYVEVGNGPFGPTVELVDYSIGWGSVSDQNGMNTLFRALGLPLYFSRKGGASID